MSDGYRWFEESVSIALRGRGNNMVDRFVEQDRASRAPHVVRWGDQWDDGVMILRGEQLLLGVVSVACALGVPAPSWVINYLVPIRVGWDGNTPCRKNLSAFVMQGCKEKPWCVRALYAEKQKPGELLVSDNAEELVRFLLKCTQEASMSGVEWSTLRRLL